MLGELILDTDIGIPTGGLAALPGALLGFDVEEDEMLVEIRFLGYTDTGSDAAPLTVEWFLQFDGEAIGAAEGQMVSTTPGTDLRFSKLVRLDKGSHTLQLALNASAASQLDGDALFPTELQVFRLSNDAVLAHGVNSKDKGLF